jgi:hypothetical protein
LLVPKLCFTAIKLRNAQCRSPDEAKRSPGEQSQKPRIPLRFMRATFANLMALTQRVGTMQTVLACKSVALRHYRAGRVRHLLRGVHTGAGRARHLLRGVHTAPIERGMSCAASTRRRRRWIARQAWRY